MTTQTIPKEEVGGVTKATFPNGLKIILREAHTSPLVSAWCWYHVGSKDEAPGHTGISHWVEHMNFKGSENFRKEEMKGLIERKGGSWNGYTWIDQTCYLSTLSSDGLDLILRLEADRMARCLYEEEEIRSERTVIISELEGGENNPEEVLDREVVSAAFRAHPYSWPTIGWLTDLNQITPTMLREYYRTYYIPNNATLVLVGDFETSKALALAEKHFGPIPRGEEPRRVATEEPPQMGERRIRVEREGEATYMQVSYHAPAVTDEDACGYLLLDAILSGGKGASIWSGDFDRTRKSSRLYRSLVDGGLAARAGSFYIPTEDPYLHSVLITVKDGTEPIEVERVLDEEIEKVKSDGISDREFEKALNQVRSALVLGADSVTKIAHELGFFETIHDSRWYLDLIPNLEKVPKEDVSRLAKKYLNPENRTVGLSVPSRGKGRGDAPPRPAGGGRHVRRARFASGLAPQDGASREIGTGVSASAASGVHPSRRVLSNGLVALSQENRLIPSVTFSLRMKSATFIEPEGKKGSGYLVARLLDAGTRSRTKEQIAEAMDFTGAALTISTDCHSIDIHVSVLEKEFPTVLSLIADLIRDPIFPEEELEKMRGHVLLAIREDLDDTRAEADRGLREAIYPEGHPYRYPILGYEDDVKAIQREHLANFYRDTYSPANATIVLVGNTDPDEATRLVEDAFGGWTGTGKPAVDEIADVPWAKESTERIIPMRNKTQADIALGCRGIRRSHPDYHPASVMNFVLGRFGMGGRLGQNIREDQGLAYYAYSSFSPSVGPGPFAVHVGANPERVEKAVAAILEELKRIKDDGITEEELEEVKGYLTGSLPRAIETNSGIASQIQGIEFHGLGLDYLDRYPDLVRSVTREQALEAARKHIDTDGYALCIAGPWERSILKGGKE
ncbi:MAG: pitrilysin family protein [Planctomycetota bacterium]|nr:pitrilysin family protein [Planctomycetota bacterium]